MIIGGVIMVVIPIEQIQQEKTVHTLIRMKRPEIEIPETD